MRLAASCKIHRGGRMEIPLYLGTGRRCPVGEPTFLLGQRDSQSNSLGSLVIGEAQRAGV